MRYLLDKLHTELLAAGLGGASSPTIVSRVFGGTLQSDVSIGRGGRGGWEGGRVIGERVC